MYKLLTLVFLGCDQAPGPDPTDTDEEPRICASGDGCVDDVPDRDTWAAISARVATPEVRSAAKFLSPARDDARIPTIFLDAQEHPLHIDLLTGPLADRFPGITPPAYLDLVLPAGRELFAGGIQEMTDGTWAFTVLDDPQVPASTVTQADLTRLHAALSADFLLGELKWLPITPLQQAAAAGFVGAPFDIIGLEPVSYEAYVLATGYGTIRHYDPAGFAAATAEVGFGFRDILVLDEAPIDVERPISGAVTGTRQAALSHLNVRSAARGTPSCYAEDLQALVEAWDGRLVQLTCAADGLEVRAASLTEAEAAWDALRPAPVEVEPPDLDQRDLSPLLALPTTDVAARELARRQYGSKGTNLAALYQRLPGDAHEFPGFLIPISAYDDHLRAATWTVDLGDGPTNVSLYDTLEAWHADPAFYADGAARRDQLLDLADAIQSATVDEALLATVAAEIRATFPANQGVRLRSSSNVEDVLTFSGAGLYDSTTACIADDDDDDVRGPSRCDPDQDDERPLADALRGTWASLWRIQAWEEREWYGVDHTRVGMGVLVNPRTRDEAANIVAFTGDPNDADDDRMLINAQAGDLEVVSADPGVHPEQVRLTLADGAVSRITREVASSEVPAGAEVLDDDAYRSIGALLWTISQTFPLDQEPPPGRDVVWDTEWKQEASGRLVIKQIRPFLR